MSGALYHCNTKSRDVTSRHTILNWEHYQKQLWCLLLSITSVIDKQIHLSECIFTIWFKRTLYHFCLIGLNFEHSFLDFSYQTIVCLFACLMYFTYIQMSFCAFTITRLHAIIFNDVPLSVNEFIDLNIHPYMEKRE